MKTESAKQRRTFDDLLACSRVFVFGASSARGGPLAFLRSRGVTVAALADNDASLHGATLGGLSVLSARELVARLGEGDAVVIASAHQVAIFRQLVDELRVPVDRVYPYVDELVFDAHRVEALADARDELDRVRSSLSDEPSRAYFDSLVSFRSHLDPRRLVPNPHVRRQYAYGQLTIPRRGDIILDGGAFDGETAAGFLERCGGECTVICVEALPSNVGRLRQRLADAIRAGSVRVEAGALAARAGELYIDDSQPGADANTLARVVSGSAEAASSAVRVRATTLDELCVAGVDFIKLDIEGSEEAALEGGRAVIARFAPAVAISAYHRAQDIWRLPQLIAELMPESLVFAAHHPIALHEIEYFIVPRVRT